MRFLSLLVLLMAGGPAVAECPTRAALESGRTAYVAYPDGGVVELAYLGEGMVQETTRYPEGNGDFRMISMGGIFIIDEVNLEDDQEVAKSRIRSRYTDAIADRLPLGPNQEFSVTAVNSFADGTEPEHEYIDVRTGSEDEIDVAGCRYVGFPMLLSYRWDVEGFTSMMMHLPDLGVSLELARMDQGAEPEPYAPLYFSMLPP